jgi:hypothetical protein
MANDVQQSLTRLKADAAELKLAEARLQRAFEKIDGQLSRLGIGLRLEPEPVRKGGPLMGCRRYHDGWRLTTVIDGLAEMQAELPIHEAPAELQRELVPHVGAVMAKLSKQVAGRLADTRKAATEAERILEAVANA